MLSEKLIRSLDTLIIEFIQGNPEIKFFLKSNSDELSADGVWDEVEEYIQNSKKIYQEKGLWVDELNYDVESLNLFHKMLVIDEDAFDKATIIS